MGRSGPTPSVRSVGIAKSKYRSLTAIIQFSCEPVLLVQPGRDAGHARLDFGDRRIDELGYHEPFDRVDRGHHGVVLDDGNGVGAIVNTTTPAWPLAMATV